MYKKNQNRNGVTLLIVLALMVMFALLVTAFMVIVSLNRQTAEINAQTLIHGQPLHRTGEFDTQRNFVLGEAFQRLMTGTENLDNVIAPHSILENLYGDKGTAITRFGGTGAGLELDETDGKPFALRPNILAPNVNGTQAYKEYLEAETVLMNPDYTAPDYMTMFLAWNDFYGGELQGIIPSFHRPQLVKYWNSQPDAPFEPNELRKYVLRPLPTDHPDFTGSNPAANEDNLLRFLTEGPWDVDNDGDGIADSIWLDIGLPPITDPATGLKYKLLVSYYVIDLDGRININTISHEYLDSSAGTARGMGIGPAELYSDLLTKDFLVKRNKDITSDSSDLRQEHGINWEAYTKGGLIADWFGTVPIKFDDLGNRVPPSNVPQGIPYSLNPYDTPFEEKDWELFVRSVLEIDYNRDYNGLEPGEHLRDLLDDNLYDPDKPALTSPPLRYSLGIQSSDIPVAAIYAPVQHNNDTVTFQERAKDLGLWELLPQEIQDGRKVNLNRLTLLGKWMSGGDDNELLIAKFEFAQEIFFLLWALFPEQAEEPASRERLAQWSVNLVDFMDPDDVMTPFIFHTSDSPADADIADLDNTALIEHLLAGTLEVSELADRMLIWGFEKPEVAITETFAVHDRRVTVKGNIDTSGTAGRSEINIEPTQEVRPQGALWIELQRQGNEHRTYPDNSTVGQDGLNLAERTRDRPDGDYIWRLAVGEAAKTQDGKFSWKGDDNDKVKKNAIRQLLEPESGGLFYPQFYQWKGEHASSERQYRPDLGAPERFIWFGDSVPTAPSDGDTLETAEIRRRSFVNINSDNDNSNVLLAPGGLLVIRPGINGFVPDIPNSTKTMVAQTRNDLGDPIAELNVSEPLPTTGLLEGYHDKPDPGPTTVPFDEGILRQLATVPCYKTISLQRLADPNRPYHPIRNPYITVDWNMIDLQVINTRENPEEWTRVIEMLSDAVSNMEIPSGLPPPLQAILNAAKDAVVAGLGALQNALFGVTRESLLGFIDNNILLNDNVPDLLKNPIRSAIESVTFNAEEDIPRDENMCFSSRQWGQETEPFNFWDRTLTKEKLDEEKAGLKPHDYDRDLPQAEHTFGESNHSGRHLHFPWRDAPLMNTGELLLVPATTPGRFGIEFHDNDDSDEFYGTYDWLTQTGQEDDKPRFGYHYEGSTFGLYPNWAGEQPDGVPSEMLRLFDFVYVPTKFADNERASDGTVIREPGKFNLNTITEEGWKALANGRDDFPDYHAFNTYREQAQAPEGEPLRSAMSTLLDLELIDDSGANPYTALENAMRLSDVTTTRSNVFAIWITVGYFQVEKFENRAALVAKYPARLEHITDAAFNAVYPDGYVLGVERGLVGGTTVRHRAFYLIDRSFPPEEDEHGGSFEFERGAKRNDIKEFIIEEMRLD